MKNALSQSTNAVRGKQEERVKKKLKKLLIIENEKYSNTNIGVCQREKKLN